MDIVANIFLIADQLSHQASPPKPRLQQYRKQIQEQYKDAEKLYDMYKNQTGDSTFRTKLMPVQKWGDGWTKEDKWKEIQLRVLKVKEILDFLLKNLKIPPKEKGDYSSVSGIINDNKINIKTLNKVSSVFNQMKTTAGGKRKSRKKKRKTKRKKRKRKRKTKRRKR